MAARFEALNRLWMTVRESNHDFRASTDIFPIFDTQKVSESLDLVGEGAKNGAQNRPVKSARTLDEVEQQIIAKAEEEKKASYQVLEDQFQTFGERLRSLDFEGQFSLIRQASITSLSDFKAEVTIGEDELHGLRKDMKTAEDELNHFKETHGLKRAAKETTSSYMFLKISVLIFIVLFETIVNGVFLARGSAQGLVGGVVEAFTFAVLNVGLAFVLAVLMVRNMVKRSWFSKFIGLVGACIYVVGAIGINLALAHYRELSEAAFSDVGRAVISQLKTEPFGLEDIKSWTLFGIGLLFSIGALVDGYYMTDPYPGFSSTQKRFREARQQYVERKQDLIEELKDVRDEYNEKVDLIIRDLSQRRAEHQAIIAHRARNTDLFREHQNQLERSANSLLSIYRDANRAARTDPEPKYFLRPYKMDRLKPAQAAEEWNDKDLAERIRQAQEELTDQMKRIGEEFNSAVDRYTQLDILFPEA
jgi:hypothetical protein